MKRYDEVTRPSYTCSDVSCSPFLNFFNLHVIHGREKKHLG
jgi:hypothetical protein